MIGSSVAMAQPKPITACGTTISTPGFFCCDRESGCDQHFSTCINVTRCYHRPGRLHVNHQTGERQNLIGQWRKALKNSWNNSNR